MISSEAIVGKLICLNATVSTAESCTGGLVADSIVQIPGASMCYNEGFITYSNEAKMELLGVSADTLNNFGAVSADCAMEMAQGVKNKANATFGVATTGIAGPGGGTPSKPIGLVYIAVAYDEFVEVVKLNLSGTRAEIRQEAKDKALELLNICIDKYKVQ